MRRLFFVLVIVCLLSSCTDPEGATRALRTSGFSKIEITGYSFFNRGKDDFYSTGFRAIAPNGETVTGAVTGGLFFKGNTIRLD